MSRPPDGGEKRIRDEQDLPENGIEHVHKKLKQVSFNDAIPLASRPTIKIGIDIGTTRTSVAYELCYSEDRNLTLRQILGAGEVIEKWPDTTGNSRYVPTVALYTLTGELGRDIKCWGYEVDDARTAFKMAEGQSEVNFEVVKLMKLLLHKSERTKSQTTKLESIAQRMDKDPLKFVEDFMNVVCEFLLDYLHKVHGSQMKESPLMLIKVGTPPSWIDSENTVFHDVLKSAIDAQISKHNQKARKPIVVKISLGSEPEATAAVHAARNESDFMVCPSIASYESY